MALFTTALDLHGGVLRSGELQGLIVHEMMPALTSSQWKRTPLDGVAVVFFFLLLIMFDILYFLR
jgi:hypothetical protein